MIRACPICGTEFEASGYQHRRRFCSERCKGRYYTARHKRGPVERHCRVCDAPFLADRKTVCCSAACHRIDRNKKAGERRQNYKQDPAWWEQQRRNSRLARLRNPSPPRLYKKRTKAELDATREARRDYKRTKRREIKTAKVRAKSALALQHVLSEGLDARIKARKARMTRDEMRERSRVRSYTRYHANAEKAAAKKRAWKQANPDKVQASRERCKTKQKERSYVDISSTQIREYGVWSPFDIRPEKAHRESGRSNSRGDRHDLSPAT